MSDYAFLKPFTFKNQAITLKNRIVIPPMTTRLSFEDGTVTQDEIEYYQKRAGGVGLFITGTANVNPLGKGFEGELSVADDRFIPGLSRLATAMKTGGSKAVLQIFSAGRMSNSKILRGQQPVSASAVAAPRPGYETPRALTTEEIEATIHDFGQAVRRAIEAGFDGVELHGANTYLIQQFYSPHSNRRTDEWGGTRDKRMRFPLAVVHEAEKVIAETADRPFLLGYRISPEELEQPGITLDDTLALIDALKATKIDYLHVSQSDVWRTSLRDPDNPAIINDVIRDHVAGALPIIVVGGIKTPEEAEKAAAAFDLVAIGHEMIREPHWVQKILAHDEKAIRYQIAPEDLDELGIAPTFLDFIESISGGAKGVPLTTATNDEH